MMYRELHQLADLVRVNFDLSSSAICRTLLRQMEFAAEMVEQLGNMAERPKS